MKCDNVFCVYEQKGHCTLSEISIDAQGFCRDCIYVSIDAATVSEAKATTLRKLET